jgi:ATP synthase protein I
MNSEEHLSDAVNCREQRKLHAQRTPQRSVWMGFRFFGLIGWSVVVPTLAGAAVGNWIDRSQPGGDRNWTLTLLLAGLVLGCFNAWRWVSREHREIVNEQHGPHRPNSGGTP